MTSRYGVDPELLDVTESVVSFGATRDTVAAATREVSTPEVAFCQRVVVGAVTWSADDVVTSLDDVTLRFHGDDDDAAVVPLLVWNEAVVNGVVTATGDQVPPVVDSDGIFRDVVTVLGRWLRVVVDSASGRWVEDVRMVDVGLLLVLATCLAVVTDSSGVTRPRLYAPSGHGSWHTYPASGSAH